MTRRVQAGRIAIGGDAPLVLLAGGRDKDLPWGAFADEVLNSVRWLIAFGEAGPMIAETVDQVRASVNGIDASSHSPELEGVTTVGRLEEAVEEAARRARVGDVVLLSPGGTSFDAFEDFAARGERFCELVSQLGEVEA